MVNQLGKFSSQIAELSQPLCSLLSTKLSWTWGPAQDNAFAQLKAELTRPIVLAHYCLTAETRVSADAFSYGLGAVLLQQERNIWRPVCFASRSMTKTENRYAQIEKVALAISWACDKFHNYLIGRRFLIGTDHKPLVPLLSTKQLDNLPPRVLRFRLRLMRFDYTVEHIPGKLQYAADALSRAPLPDTTCKENLQSEVEEFIDAVTTGLIMDGRLEEVSKSQATDPVCSKLIKYCRFGWRDRHRIEGHLNVYWSRRGHLTVHKGQLIDVWGPDNHT